MTATGKATVRIDDAAIKARMRGLLAQAWDEGHVAGSSYGHRHALRGGAIPQPNPYRDEAGA